MQKTTRKHKAKPKRQKKLAHHTFEQTKASSNDYATLPVPQEKRSSAWILSLQLAGVAICISGLFSGAALAKGLNFQEILLATICGNAIGALLGGFVGAIGCKLGLSTTMISRRSFGIAGSSLVSIMAAVTLVGWYAVQVGFFGSTIHSLCPNAPTQVAALIGGLLMMTTAYFGYRGIAVLSAIAVPILFITSGIGVYKAVSTYNIQTYVPVQSFSLAHGITMAVGSFAVGAVLLSDMTRYAKSVKDSWIATVVCFLLANTFIMLSGAMTFIATNSGDLPAAMLALGMGTPALLVLIFSQWTTNDNNLYSASLAVSNISKMKKKHVVIILGCVATIIGALGLAENLTVWLTYLGVLIPPVGGIIICDFWILNSKANSIKLNEGFKRSAIIAWISGAAAGAFINWGIPSLTATFVSLIVYLIIETRKNNSK